jgi:tRNA G10  N-methylase Trm11
MMLEKDLVTIALHSGKKEYYPLIENFLKSMLKCIEYPRIEIMLIESAGNQEIRSWFERIDFDSNFVNFLGSRSSIKKDSCVEIIKTVKFYDFPAEYEWFECFTQSIQQAINECKGEYFCFFAEDNQFTVKGDVLSDYIKIMEKENNFKSFVHFFAQQKYKLYKKNNYFDKKSLKIFRLCKSLSKNTSRGMVSQ